MNLLPMASGWRWAIPGNVYCCDALELLRALPDGSIQLILTDPPFNVGKNPEWDKWPSVSAYIDWLETHLREMRRVLATNGSLYLFAAPHLATDVELAIRQYFRILNRITWHKPTYSTKAEMFDKDTMRRFFPASETIIFAEPMGADANYTDALITENATYWQACERAKGSIFGDYLSAEFERAGVTRRQIAALFPSATGNLTGCVSNWLIGYNIPTSEQYAKMRAYLNTHAGGDYLSREYEDLRREYEDLRRPFNSSKALPYTDVWDYKTVNVYPGKHPCEKPFDMMRDIVTLSSRPGDVVLDPFTGSGVSLQAAHQLGRQWMGCDFDATWARKANHRIRLPWTVPMFAEDVA